MNTSNAPMTDAAGRRLQRGVMAPVPERAIAVREAAPALRAGKPKEYAAEVVVEWAA